MPYNTRRKSLSLSSLGIHVPASSRVHRSPPQTATPDPPPSKRSKRSHPSSASSSASPTTLVAARDRPRSSGRIAQNTPPPSPGDATQPRVQTEGIGDAVVVAVIDQLETTGNRPHLLKELAAVLATSLPLIESSANPSAIISSRLAAYCRRPWTALSPCPLEKMLVGTHPRRVYYYLANAPRQPIPTESPGPTANRIISPSLSNASEEDEETRARDCLSLSPEVDLGNDFDCDADLRHDSFGDLPRLPMDVDMSPRLEREEREFEKVVSTFQERRFSEDTGRAAVKPLDHTFDPAMDGSAESDALRHDDACLAPSSVFSSHFGSQLGSSPLLRQLDTPLPMRTCSPHGVRLSTPGGDDDLEWSWAAVQRPEKVGLQELDDMFGGY